MSVVESDPWAGSRLENLQVANRRRLDKAALRKRMAQPNGRRRQLADVRPLILEAADALERDWESLGGFTVHGFLMTVPYVGEMRARRFFRSALSAGRAIYPLERVCDLSATQRAIVVEFVRSVARGAR